MPVDRCDECRFDGTRWTDQDVLTSLRVMSELWRGHLEGADTTVLTTRPDELTWSIAEYTHHVGDTLWAMRFLTDVAVRAPGTDLGMIDGGDGIDPEPATVDVEAALARVGEESLALRDALVAVPTESWSTATVTFDGEQVDLAWIGRHALHDAMHHLHDVGRIRVRLGDGVPTQRGSVANLARSDGGVPKLPASAVDVDVDGVVGDRQGDRKHHGRPFQALCLWSQDVIEALQAEGHPITPGAAGENVTIAGIDWASLRPGTRLRIGNVLCELSAAATPCAKNARWFADGGFARIDHDQHPGWGRLYATVLEPGPIAVGDPVEVEPDA